MVKVQAKYPSEKVATAQKVVVNAVQEVGIDCVAIAYNGGKDSIALTHLVRSAIGMDVNIKLLMWHTKGEFDEVMQCINTFLHDASCLEVIQFSDSREMIKDVQELVEQGTQYVFLGTRFADLKSGEKAEFIKPMWGGGTRVMPLMQFSIEDIGEYLRFHRIPYPSLYNEGYTSLGTQKSTIRNPFLYDASSETFAPAWNLRRPKLERANRAYINHSMKNETSAILCPEELDPAILEIAVSEIGNKGFESIAVFHLDRDLKSLRSEYKFVWVLWNPTANL